MRSDAMTKLDARELVARARVRAAARDLKHSLLSVAGVAAQEHPWSLPAVGFCTGFLATFLVPERRHHPEENGHARWK
jgi:hypothetical protein